MNRKAPLIVFDADGTVGFIDPEDRPRAGVSAVAIRLDDGRTIQVPADGLAAEPDGRYRLLVARADLERPGVRGTVGATADRADGGADAAETTVIPLVAEEIEVGKRKVEGGKVRVKKGVVTREETVSVPLVREVVEVERVPINRPVSGPVEPRREGDVWIVPVLEEVLVVEKRLMLKEEMRITRRKVEETATERVTLRAETATVERTDPAGEAPGVEPIHT